MEPVVDTAKRGGESREEEAARRLAVMQRSLAPARLQPTLGSTSRKYVKFSGRLIMVGCGGIGQGVMPLLFRHIVMYPSQMLVLTGDKRGRDVAEAMGVEFRVCPITHDNCRSILMSLLNAGDFLLNLSVDVSSVDLIQVASERGACYLDTCTEPWAGGYTDKSLSIYDRSNYGQREAALALGRRLGPDAPTAVITNGANPGLVSHFVKAALMELARDVGLPPLPKGRQNVREAWGELARSLGVKAIHIAERDTQVSAGRPKEVGEFVNTWSVDGFASEGMQPSELGWGTHERHFPIDGRRHDRGCGSAIYLMQPGMTTRVRSWTPNEGPYHGYLVTHSESISIADYLTVRSAGGEAVYRPTVHYAYHPCDNAMLSIHEVVGKNWRLQDRKRLMMDEITSGIDELGVLLMGHERGAFWYGSQLSVEESRFLCPYNSATTLQVTSSVLAGICWAIENPRRGVVEPDYLDWQYIMEIVRPYLGNLTGVYSDWTPLISRSVLFPEDVDASDPWQFKNFRV